MKTKHCTARQVVSCDMIYFHISHLRCIKYYKTKRQLKVQLRKMYQQVYPYQLRLQIRLIGNLVTLSN